MAKDQFIFFEERLSDSPFVERIWRSHTERGGPFLSMAISRCELVFTRLDGKTSVTVRGPETRATTVDCPAGGEWFGVLFKLGSFPACFPPGRLVDTRVDLPEASGKSFWFDGSAWQYPNYENVDAFIDRLARGDLIARDPIVEEVVRGQMRGLSPRSVQRRFAWATGLTHAAARQIERARFATLLLQQGAPILDAVEQGGYFDQPHLTHALKHYVGQTPAQLAAGDRAQQLSYLYKTELFHA